jgi:hypothetical protein
VRSSLSRVLRLLSPGRMRISSSGGVRWRGAHSRSSWCLTRPKGWSSRCPTPPAGCCPHSAPVDVPGSARLRHTLSASPPPRRHHRTWPRPLRRALCPIPSRASSPHACNHGATVSRTCACRNESVHVALFGAKLRSMAAVLCKSLWPVARSMFHGRHHL